MKKVIFFLVAGFLFVLLIFYSYHKPLNKVITSMSAYNLEKFENKVYTMYSYQDIFDETVNSTYHAFFYKQNESEPSFVSKVLTKIEATYWRFKIYLTYNKQDTFLLWTYYSVITFKQGNLYYGYVNSADINFDKNIESLNCEEIVYLLFSANKFGTYLQQSLPHKEHSSIVIHSCGE